MDLLRVAADDTTSKCEAEAAAHQDCDLLVDVEIAVTSPPRPDAPTLGQAGGGSLLGVVAVLPGQGLRHKGPIDSLGEQGRADAACGQASAAARMQARLDEAGIVGETIVLTIGDGALDHRLHLGLRPEFALNPALQNPAQIGDAGRMLAKIMQRGFAHPAFFAAQWWVEGHGSMKDWQHEGLVDDGMAGSIRRKELAGSRDRAPSSRLLSGLA